MAGSASKGGPERRRSARAALRLPIRIDGYYEDGAAWSATSTTEDASAGGARFPLSQEVRIGHALLLNLPMPRALRDRDHWDADYRTWALVRHVERSTDGSWKVGVMFYGRNPPRGFHESPGARFLLPRDVASVAPEPLPHEEDEAPTQARDPHPDDQRSEERFDIFVNLTLMEMDEFGVVLREEVTVAENLSRSGARVMTSHRFARGDVLIVQEVDGDFACRAEVCDAWLGADRVRRLNLEFLDGRQPLHLLPRT